MHCTSRAQNDALETQSHSTQAAQPSESAEKKSTEGRDIAEKQWCSLRDTQVYAVYPLGKSKDFRIPT